MARPLLPIVATGSANLASVRVAFERLGHDAVATTDAAMVKGATHLVVPGVGAFGAAMESLERAGLIEPLKCRLQAGLPTLCICLGMQLLCDSSEESPGVRGLGIVPGSVSRFDNAPGVRVPQLSWNRVTPRETGGILEAGWAYYANSYRLREPPAGWTVAMSDYSGPFVGAMQREGVLACQFHPELSGSWGGRLLERWLRGGEGVMASNDSVGRIGRHAVPRIIPCLDVNAGRVVKGVRFANLRDMGDPSELAAMYERQGADELVVLDVSATLEGRSAHLRTVEAVRRAIAIPLTVGGGVRSIDDAKALLDAGADKVSVNSAAVRDPSLLTAMAARFGRQCVVIAIDAVKDGSHVEERWSVMVRGGRDRVGLDAVEWAREAEARGAGEVLLTSHDRDGTRRGYDLALLSAVSRAVNVPVIASGGAHAPEHLVEALGAGASAVLAASIFHESDYTVQQIKSRLGALGVEVRT